MGKLELQYKPNGTPCQKLFFNKKPFDKLISHEIMMSHGIYT